MTTCRCVATTSVPTAEPRRHMLLALACRAAPNPGPRQRGLPTSVTHNETGSPRAPPGSQTAHPRVSDAGNGLVPHDARRPQPLLPLAAGAAGGGARRGDRARRGRRPHAVTRRRRRRDAARTSPAGLLARTPARGRRAPSVIDAHFALYAAAPLLLGALRGRPMVFHFHGPWAQENVAAGDSSRSSYVLRAALERCVLRRADAHVVLSSAFRRVLVERYRVRPWDVHVWPPGVALERVHARTSDRSRARARLGIDAQAFVAVCVRRLVPRMGLDVLLDAWERIQTALPAGSALLLVGDGPLRDALAERAARAPLSGGVRLLGRVSRGRSGRGLPRRRRGRRAERRASRASAWSCPRRPRAARRASSATSAACRRWRCRWTARWWSRPGTRRRSASASRRRRAGSCRRASATRSFAERFSWPLLAERHRAPAPPAGATASATSACASSISTTSRACRAARSR